MSRLKILLDKVQVELKKGNHKQASVEVGRGIDICKIEHRKMNEGINPEWDLRKQWDYKNSYTTNGKRLQYWSEKFWTLLEDNNLDLVLRDEVNLEPIMTMLIQGKNSNGHTESATVNM